MVNFGMSALNATEIAYGHVERPHEPVSKPKATTSMQRADPVQDGGADLPDDSLDPCPDEGDAFAEGFRIQHAENQGDDEQGQGIARGPGEQRAVSDGVVNPQPNGGPDALPDDKVLMDQIDEQHDRRVLNGPKAEAISDNYRRFVSLDASFQDGFMLHTGNTGLGISVLTNHQNWG